MCLARPALAEHEIEFSGIEFRFQRFTEPDDQLQIDARVCLAEVVQYARELGGNEIVGNAETKPPRQRRLGEVVLRFRGGIENRAGEPDHCRAVAGEFQVSGVAEKQLASHCLLEPRDVATDRGLPQPEKLPARRESAFAFDGEEGSEQDRIESHNSDLSQNSFSVNVLIVFRDQSETDIVSRVNFLRGARPDGFVLGIFATAAMASILPATGTAETVLGWCTKFAIGLLFLIYGARLSPQEAWQGVKHWRLHSVVLATTYVLFPLIGLALRILEPSVLSADLYTGILFLCLVPSTVQSSIAFTSIAKGNVAGAVVSASFSNIVGVFVTPLLVILLLNTSGDAHVDASSILNIVAQLLLPFIAGQLIRPLVKGWLARHSGPTKIVDRGSILLVVYSAFSESMNQHVWSAVSVWQIVGVVAVCCAILALVLTLTHFVGRAMGFPLPDRIVLVFCGSKKSLASGLPMASVLFVGQPVGLIVLPLLLFHQIQLMVCAVLAQRYAAQSPVKGDAEAAVPG